MAGATAKRETTTAATLKTTTECKSLILQKALPSGLVLPLHNPWQLVRVLANWSSCMRSPNISFPLFPPALSGRAYPYALFISYVRHSFFSLYFLGCLYMHLAGLLLLLLLLHLAAEGAGHGVLAEGLYGRGGNCILCLLLFFFTYYYYLFFYWCRTHVSTHTAHTFRAWTQRLLLLRFNYL